MPPSCRLHLEPHIAAIVCHRADVMVCGRIRRRRRDAPRLRKFERSNALELVPEHELFATSPERAIGFLFSWRARAPTASTASAASFRLRRIPLCGGDDREVD